MSAANLKLVQAFSDTRYPFTASTPFLEPLDLDYREQLTRNVNRGLLKIDAQPGDVKIVESTYSLQLWFRQKVDLDHYNTFFTNEDVEEPLLFELHLPEKRRFPNEARRLKNWINQAASQSEQQSALKVSSDPETHVVLIEAPDMETFFKMWRYVPLHRRSKIAQSQTSYSFDNLT